MKEYVPIFFDFIDNTQDLTDEECGRLIKAVILYASGNEYEHLLTGAEKIAFRFMKGQVDRNAAISDARSKAGSIKKYQNETNDIKTEQTETNFPKEKDKEKEKENKKEEKEERLAISERFVRFWKAYPRKVGKENALKAWMSLKPDEELLTTMIQAIEKQKDTEQWKESGGQYIPHPSTWLRGKRWQDEVTTTTKQKTVVAQDYEQRDYSGVQDKARKRFESMMEDDAS